MSNPRCTMRSLLFVVCILLFLLLLITGCSTRGTRGTGTGTLVRGSIVGNPQIIESGDILVELLDTQGESLSSASSSITADSVFEVSFSENFSGALGAVRFSFSLLNSNEVSETEITIPSDLVFLEVKLTVDEIGAIVSTEVIEAIQETKDTEPASHGEEMSPTPTELTQTPVREPRPSPDAEIARSPALTPTPSLESLPSSPQETVMPTPAQPTATPLAEVPAVEPTAIPTAQPTSTPFGESPNPEPTPTPTFQPTETPVPSSSGLDITGVQVYDENGLRDTLSDGAVLNYGSRNRIITFRIETSPEVESLRIRVFSDGIIDDTQTENSLPYYAFGDRSNEPTLRNLRPGSYLISVTPFSSDDESGEEGETLVLQFELR